MASKEPSHELPGSSGDNAEIGNQRGQDPKVLYCNIKQPSVNFFDYWPEGVEFSISKEWIDEMFDRKAACSIKRFYKYLVAAAKHSNALTFYEDCSYRVLTPPPFRIAEDPAGNMDESVKKISLTASRKVLHAAVLHSFVRKVQLERNVITLCRRIDESIGDTVDFLRIFGTAVRIYLASFKAFKDLKKKRTRFLLAECPEPAAPWITFLTTSFNEDEKDKIYKNFEILLKRKLIEGPF